MKKRIFALLLALVLALSLLPLGATADDTEVGDEIITIDSNNYNRGSYPEIAALGEIDSKYGDYCLGIGVFDNSELIKASYKPGTSSDGNVDKTFAAGIFRVSGNEDDPSFEAAPSVWTALEQAGYKLSLKIYPTKVNDKFAVSCEGSYYPTESDYNDNETWKAAKTYHFSMKGPCCAGTWMIEAMLSNGTTPLHAYTFQTVSFHSEVTWNLSEYSTAETINEAIASKSGLSLPQGVPESEVYISIILGANGDDNGSENPLAGYIDIPAAFDSFAGLQLVCPFGEGSDHTYIEGGVKTNIRQLTVQNIYFYGAGADNQTWNDGSDNYGLVGPGQGVFRNCLFFGFYHAVHRYSRTGQHEVGVASFGGSDTVFENNDTAIYIDVDRDTGGNDDLENCIFKNNGTAIQIENIPAALDLVYVKIRENRFDNNAVDIDNETNSILWAPYNTFHHMNGDDHIFSPVFNDDTVNDCPAVVACPYYGDGPDALIYPDDSYLRNDSPEDALIPTELINGQNFNMVDDAGNAIGTFSFTEEN